MGRRLKLAAAVVGLVSFGVGAWPLGALCFLCLAVTLWPRRLGHFSSRQFLGMVMFLLSAMAVAFGGTLSPFVFAVAGAALLAWPAALRSLHFDVLVPVEGSIMMKTNLHPFTWAALAELKPGPEEFPRSVSGFSGSLLVFTDTGQVYSIARCSALDMRVAETKVLDAFRESLPTGGAAYLMPLSSSQAAGVLRQRFTKTGIPMQQLAQSASRISGAMLLECDGGFVRKASVSGIRGVSAEARLPVNPGEVASPPLAWEVFEALGKRTKWPAPDSFSGLLNTMLATRGVPLGERIKELEGSGEEVRVRSLSGEEVTTTRAQLRALISIYS